MDHPLNTVNESNKRLHLQFIQDAITRLSHIAYDVKIIGVSIILIFLLGYFFTDMKYRGVLAVSSIITITSWVLDSYYLQQERKFRKLYNDIIAINPNSSIKEFEMPIQKYKVSLLNCFCSITLVLFWLSLLVVQNLVLIVTQLSF